MIDKLAKKVLKVTVNYGFSDFVILFLSSLKSFDGLRNRIITVYITFKTHLQDLDGVNLSKEGMFHNIKGSACYTCQGCFM